MPKLHQFKGLLRKFRRKENNEAATVSPVSTTATTTTLQAAQDGSSSILSGSTPTPTANQVQVGKGPSSGESKGIATVTTAKNPAQAVSKGIRYADPSRPTKLELMQNC